GGRQAEPTSQRDRLPAATAHGTRPVLRHRSDSVLGRNPEQGSNREYTRREDATSMRSEDDSDRESVPYGSRRDADRELADVDYNSIVVGAGPPGVTECPGHTRSPVRTPRRCPGRRTGSPR